MADVRASRGRRVWNLIKTLVLLVCFWIIFLLMIPLGVSIVEVELGIQRFPPATLLAATLLLLGTLLSVWAAVTMALVGDGTPLPADATRRLVVRGPYAFVRNPLVIAALMQGTGIGTALGSIPVLTYVTLGGAFWYFFLRPAEERSLAERFGTEWKRYQTHVRSWRPRLRPYRS